MCDMPDEEVRVWVEAVTCAVNRLYQSFPLRKRQKEAQDWEDYYQTAWLYVMREKGRRAYRKSLSDVSYQTAYLATCALNGLRDLLKGVPEECPVGRLGRREVATGRACDPFGEVDVRLLLESAPEEIRAYLTLRREEVDVGVIQEQLGWGRKRLRSVQQATGDWLRGQYPDNWTVQGRNFRRDSSTRGAND